MRRSNTLLPMFLEENLQGSQHIGIPVTDLETSKAFYGAFGFNEVMYAEIPANGDSVKASMMSKAGFTIELYQLVGEGLQEIATRQDGHVDHIAMNVLDVDKAFVELKAAGMDIIEEAPVRLDFWENGCKYFTIRGPDGEKLEFNQILQ